MISSNSRLMVFSAHADDEALNSGGTIIKYLNSGASVYVLYFFPKKELNEVHAKFREYGGNIKYKVMIDEHFDGLINGLGYHSLVSFFDKEIDSFKPDTAIIPYPNYHQDHELMHKICLTSLRISVENKSKHYVENVFEVASDFVWGRQEIYNPNLFCDITEQIEKKIEIIMLYARNGNVYDNGDNIRSIASYYGIQSGCKYAEAFRILRCKI
jgi:hypothetical protein